MALAALPLYGQRLPFGSTAIPFLSQFLISVFANILDTCTTMFLVFLQCIFSLSLLSIYLLSSHFPFDIHFIAGRLCYCHFARSVLRFSKTNRTPLLCMCTLLFISSFTLGVLSVIPGAAHTIIIRDFFEARDWCRFKVVHRTPMLS